MKSLKYCESLFHYKRRPTHEVRVGDVGIGGDNPIRVQSMTIADTMNTEATVREVIELAEAGCEIVRITAPSMNEAHNLRNIRDQLRRQGVQVPLVADIHFTPNAALIAADIVDKVRINPGNYADKKKFEVREYTDREYIAELERIRERFAPLVHRCKANGVAMRIGVNHGSLSDRIMNRYGDTPEGMVQSALEFLAICEDLSYRDIVLSMKASNPQVMIQAYRLLVARMYELGMTYPLHLGVTEAGDGEDGRIKSAVGIGALLEDGIGDTIRVSLTEDSIHEIPVAQALVRKYNRQREAGVAAPEREAAYSSHFHPFIRTKHHTYRVPVLGAAVGGDETVRVFVDAGDAGRNGAAKKLPVLGQQRNGEQHAELFFTSNCYTPASSPPHVWLPTARPWQQPAELARLPLSVAHDATTDAGEISDALRTAGRRGAALLVELEGFAPQHFSAAVMVRVLETIAEACAAQDNWQTIISLEIPPGSAAALGGIRQTLLRLAEMQFTAPLVLTYRTATGDHDWQLDAAATVGALLNEGFGDAVRIAGVPEAAAVRFIYTLLQATRVRISKTEFISCPSCGRTLFNLQTTTERIKSKTGHLKGVKIAIMGCIVNGPGEMADADFGYVGAGPGKVNLFVGKECVKRNIPESEADQRLIELIQEHGKWVEPVS